MNILVLCSKFPYPANDGGNLATLNMIQGFYLHGHNVTVLAMNTSKHSYDLDALPGHIKKLARFNTVQIDTNIRFMDAITKLLKNESYNVARFISEHFRQQLIELLNTNTFDIIQLEGLYLSPYIETIRKFSSAIVGMRAHNVESEIWNRRSFEEKNPLKKLYLKILAKQLANFEYSRLNLYDALITITSRDLEDFKKKGCKIPSHVSPFGISYEKSKDIAPPLDRDAFFIGALDWEPNLEGLDWFIQQVWPNIKNEIPEIKFHIAGRSSQASFFKKYNLENIIIHGEVDDAKEYMNEHGIMIVPLFSGSGMRVKIIEGMAMANAIVATPVAIEGIEAISNHDFILASNPKEFSEAVVRCYRDKDLIHDLATNAQNLVATKYDNKVITENLLNFYKTLLPSS